MSRQNLRSFQDIQEFKIVLRSWQDIQHVERWDENTGVNRFCENHFENIKNPFRGYMYFFLKNLRGL